MVSHKMMELMAYAINANCRVTKIKLTETEAMALAGEIIRHQPEASSLNQFDLYNFILSGNANFLGATIVVNHEFKSPPENRTIH